jgi:PAS domain S-box-containing protein
MPSPELFQELLARTRALTYVVRMDGPAGTLVYMSPRCEEILGLTAEQLIAETIEERLTRIHPDDRAAMIESSKATARTGDYDGRYRYLHPDGRVLHLLTLSRIVAQPPGEPAIRMGLILDMTAEMETSQALQESEVRYRALVERVPVVVYIDSNDPRCDTIYVSSEITNLLGHLPQEWTGDPTLWPACVHPDDRGWVTDAWEESIRTGLDFRHDYRAVHRDGHIVWVRDTTTLVRDEHGEPLFWQGVMQDISDQRLADQALRASEIRYRTLVEQVPAVVYEMGPDDERRTLYVSPHVEKILGYSRQEWLEQPDIWIELLHHEDRERELEAHDRHNRSGEPWVRTYRLIAEDGRTVWVRDQAVLVREPDQPDSQGTWHGVMLDISAQKATEEDLHISNEILEYRVRERTAELEEANALMSLEIAERQRAYAERRIAEERYRTLVEQIPAVVYLSTVTPDGPVLADYSSPQVEAMLGYTPEEWKVQTLWVARIHPHDRDRILEAWEVSKATGEPFSEEFRILAKDGRIVWVLDETSLLSRDANGRPERFQGVMIDVTARKEAEAAAVEAEARYQALASQGPVMSYVWERGPSGGAMHRYMSPQIERLLGYPMEAWNDDDQFWLTLIHPDDRERLFALEVQTEFTGEPWSTDYRVITRSGEVRWLHDEGTLLSRDDAGKPHRFHGIYIDITERKAMEQELMDAEERYRTLVEQLPAVPWTEEINTATGHSRTTYLGTQTESVLGWREDELGGDFRKLERLLHPEDHDEVISAIQAAYAEGTWDQTFRIVARDGSVRRVRSVGRCTSDLNAPMQIWKGITLGVGPVGSSDLDTSPSGGADAEVTPSA